jgi:hypothetical protein
VLPPFAVDVPVVLAPPVPDADAVEALAPPVAVPDALVFCSSPLHDMPAPRVATANADHTSRMKAARVVMESSNVKDKATWRILLHALTTMAQCW